MRVVTFKLSEPELEMLDEFCRRVGLPRSYVIRAAVRKLLEEGKIELRRRKVSVRRVVLD